MIQKPTVGSALCPAISVLYYLPLTAFVRSVLVHFVTVGSARQPIKGEIVMNDGLFDVIVFSNCQDPGWSQMLEKHFEKMFLQQKFNSGDVSNIQDIF